jgi:hypothetical protein
MASASGKPRTFMVLYNWLLYDNCSINSTDNVSVFDILCKFEIHFNITSNYWHLIS